MAVPGDEIFRSIDLEKFCGFLFLFGGARIRDRRDVMKHETMDFCVAVDSGSAIQPYRFLFFGTMIRNGRHDQVIQDMRRPIRDNLRLSPKCNEPLIYGRTVC